jgi:hypothetical protein
VNVDAIRVLPFAPSNIEQDHSSVAYSGIWNSVSAGGYSGGSAVQSNSTAASAELTFHGQGARWIARKGANQGIARVYVDGVDKGTVDLYASPQQFQVAVFEITDLSPGKHTVKIVPTGTKHPSATNTLVNIDAFTILR